MRAELLRLLHLFDIVVDGQLKTKSFMRGTVTFFLSLPSSITLSNGGASTF